MQLQFLFDSVVFLHSALLQLTMAKPDPFRVHPDFGPNFRVQTGRVGPQDPKTGPIGSGWPKKGFKFGFNPVMYLINLI